MCTLSAYTKKLILNCCIHPHEILTTIMYIERTCTLPITTPITLPTPTPITTPITSPTPTPTSASPPLPPG